MKIRYQLAAVASITAIMALGIAGAASASTMVQHASASRTMLASRSEPAQLKATAATPDVTEIAWCQGNNIGCLWSAGFDNQVLFHRTGNVTNFEAVHGTTWDGRNVSEWQQVGTNNCLEYDFSGGVIVRMDTCTAGRASQLWWSSPADSLVNDYATGQLGQQECMQAATTQNAGVFVQACDGSPTQAWFQN